MFQSPWDMTRLKWASYNTGVENTSDNIGHPGPKSPIVIRSCNQLSVNKNIRINNSEIRSAFEVPSIGKALGTNSPLIAKTLNCLPRSHLSILSIGTLKFHTTIISRPMIFDRVETSSCFLFFLAHSIALLTYTLVTTVAAFFISQLRFSQSHFHRQVSRERSARESKAVLFVREYCN